MISFDFHKILKKVTSNGYLMALVIFELLILLWSLIGIIGKRQTINIDFNSSPYFNRCEVVDGELVIKQGEAVGIKSSAVEFNCPTLRPGI